MTHAFLRFVNWSALMVALNAQPLFAQTVLPPSSVEGETIAFGRALYHGRTPFSDAIQIDETSKLMPTAAACVNCHGVRGEGTREAGTRVPGVRWHQLRTSAAALPAYPSGEAVIAAIEHARGRAGALTAPMPRYTLTARERTGLLAYLKVLGTEADATNGVNVEQILLGTVLPIEGQQRAMGESIQRGLQARIDAVNTAGGVFGRRIALVVEDGGSTPQSSALAIRRLIDERGVFAIVGSYLPDSAALDTAGINTSGIPIVATLGVPLKSSQHQRVTYLMPSVEHQLQQLWSQMALRCDFTRGADVVYSAAPGLAEAIRTSAAKAGLDISSASLGLREIMRDHEANDIEFNKLSVKRPTLALVNTSAFSGLRKAIVNERDETCLGSLAIFSGANDAATHSQTVYGRELVMLPMPPVLISEIGREKSANSLWEMLADISMRTFVEALSRTGRDVDHDRFERALISLKRFEPVAGIRLEFSAQQRHGLAVSSIWKGDLHEQAR
jgi:cytochrome c553